MIQKRHGHPSPSLTTNNRPNYFKAVKDEAPKFDYLAKIKEKQQEEKKEFLSKKEEYEKQKKEREQAINSARQKRQQIKEKLTRKTRRGQPVMKHQIHHLLEKIKKNV